MSLRLKRWVRSAPMQWLAYIVLFLLISAAVDIWRTRDIPKVQVPALNAVSLSGLPIDLLSMSKDQLVVVYFWGTWCGVCTLTSPSVDTLNRFYPVVSVAMASGSADNVRDYMQAKSYGFDVVNDPEQEIAKAWGIGVTPIILYVKNGQVVHSTTGMSFLPGLFWRALIN